MAGRAGKRVAATAIPNKKNGTHIHATWSCVPIPKIMMENTPEKIALVITPTALAMR